MSEITLSGLIQVPHGAFDALWRMADGQTALLYLFILRHNRLPQPGEAEQAGLDPANLRAAAERLVREGLVSLPENVQPDHPPSYTAKDIAEGLQRDAGFAYAVAETQKLLGKVLSSADLETLFAIYDWHGLPAEVVVLLVQYVTEDFRARFGTGGRPPTLRQILLEARKWADAGILTHEAAERHIRELEGRRSQSGRILAALGVHGRAASATERKHIDEWIAWGFPPETVALAYDRTVIACGKMAWRYCEKILKNWHDAGLHTPREVEQGDTKSTAPANANASIPRSAPSRERSARPVAPPGQAERAAMERMMNRKRKGESQP